MIQSHIDNRLRAALNEYTGVVPLVNRHGPEESTFSADGSFEGIPRRRRRFKISRWVMVLMASMGLAGTATGLAAAAGAFDESAHHAAVESFRESVIGSLRNNPAALGGSELRSVARTFKQSDLVLRATTYGPNDSTFTVWTYSKHSKAPWCYILVEALPSSAAQALGGGCQVTGAFKLANAGGYSEWPCRPGPHDRGVVGPNYFVIASQVPPGVTEVVVHGTSSGRWEALVTHGWFVVLASNKIQWPTQITYVGSNGATSTGILNIGGGTC